MGLLSQLIESEQSPTTLADPVAAPTEPLAECPTCQSTIFWFSVYGDGIARCPTCEPPPSASLVDHYTFDGERAEDRRRRLKGELRASSDDLRWQFGGIDPWADYVSERYAERVIDGWATLFRRVA